MVVVMFVFALIAVLASTWCVVLTVRDERKLIATTRDYIKSTHAYEAALVEMVDYFANRNKELEKLIGQPQSDGQSESDGHEDAILVLDADRLDQREE